MSQRTSSRGPFQSRLSGIWTSSPSSSSKGGTVALSFGGPCLSTQSQTPSVISPFNHPSAWAIDLFSIPLDQLRDFYLFSPGKLVPRLPQFLLQCRGNLLLVLPNTAAVRYLPQFHPPAPPYLLDDPGHPRPALVTSWIPHLDCEIFLSIWPGLSHSTEVTFLLRDSVKNSSSRQ